MCKLLKIPRSTFYYIPKEKDPREDKTLNQQICDIFNQSRNNYGTRKIKVELERIGKQVSRRRIGRIMASNGLVSNYTIKQYKVHRTKCIPSQTPNIVNREFNRQEALEVIVSDLTYVNVSGKWHYICLIIDLYNREIIGYAAGKHKDAQLVYKAFSRIQRDLNTIQIFHTDRGSEFMNQCIDDLLNTFKIKRSLSAKGCPYDNAVAEATYKVVKTEFAFNRKFDDFDELERELFDYIHWYNHIRIHGSLDYLTPIEYNKQCLV
ncbi:Transposase InsO and inactivated derivatives [Eubacterium barkeri]|uniref:Transposase InsO and inactivated derivatives n=1 Tax=Eubacterium barkeri TaxID=1528 RepID=A0A1H3JJT5_EUBBA|nr:Transposase InsO and inactivated derivatives [Eubacterium barkeri]